MFTVQYERAGLMSSVDPYKIPLSLYVHMPWCVSKCPYCDFNSYAIKSNFPAELYIEKLLVDFDNDFLYTQKRPINSIFFGGGTPSLFPAKEIGYLLAQINKKISFSPNIEITLEANPKTLSLQKLQDLYACGINRLSLGVQSFSDKSLQLIGRTHDFCDIKNSITLIKKAKFTNFNLDIMYGLPEQNVESALADLQSAINFAPTHISWYQLTVENETKFFLQKPKLPEHDVLFAMQEAGISLLYTHGFSRYEISAYCRQKNFCQHNLNYWQFADYIGIGAGAHSKISLLDKIIRYSKFSLPEKYLTCEKEFIATQEVLTNDQLVLEFMLNALRLVNGFDVKIFSERTGINLADIMNKINQAQHDGFLVINNNKIIPTDKGINFLNDCLEIW